MVEESVRWGSERKGQVREAEMKGQERRVEW